MLRFTPQSRRLLTLVATAVVALGTGAASSQAATKTLTLRPLGAHSSIIGGYTPHPTQWPWMAALVQQPSALPGSTDIDRRFCGGGLIAPRLVLTAAHCVSEKDGSQSRADSLQVVIGKRDLALAGGEHLNVQAIQRHPQWNPTTIRHDLALLYLAAPSSATPAQLVWQNSTIPLKTSMTVMGWGRINIGVNDRTASSALKAVDMPLWSDADCSAATTAWSNDSTLYDPQTQLCAGSNSGTDATCKGDSGSPLMFLDSTNVWRLYGVVSYGRPDCDPTSAPDVFAWLGATSMLSFVTSGIATAAGLPAPTTPAAPAAPATPRPGPAGPATPAPTSPAAPAPKFPSPTPVVSPSLASDTTAPYVNGLRVNPSVVRAGRTMQLRFSVSESGNMRVILRGPRGATASGTTYATAGSSALKLPARLGRSRMRAGRWTVAITVVDAAGNRSLQASARFRVVR